MGHPIAELSGHRLSTLFGIRGLKWSIMLVILKTSINKTLLFNQGDQCEFSWDFALKAWMTEPFLTHGAYCGPIWTQVFVRLLFIIVMFEILVQTGKMYLPAGCCETGQQSDRSCSSHSLPPLWLTALVTAPSPTVQSQWMGICWPLTHRQLSLVFEVKQHPWLGAKSIFKGVVVVVVVIQGRGRRNQRQRDALRSEIHTDASLMCDQAERQRTSVERGQHSLPPHREPFLCLATHFISSIAQWEHTHTHHTYNIRFHLWRGRRAC